MDKRALEQMGLEVREAAGRLEVSLDLVTGKLTNPLTRQFLTRASLAVSGDRLVVVDPPELVGCPPVYLPRVANAAQIERQLADSLNESIFQLSRRSAELSALGVSPHVDPVTLNLSATVDAGRYQFGIATDRLGQFRVTNAVRDGNSLPITGAHPFELSEFRDRRALEGYLTALFGEPAAQPRSSAEAPDRLGPLTFGEVVERLGAQAMLPSRSPLELLLELRVKGEPYRFAAARVSGRTFRGLLAGSAGKVWAERFELNTFPGVVPLVARVLGVPEASIELVEGGGA
ncbi:MAG: hypothetical protein ACOZIN_13785 [Myxococcota bacterium]